MENLISKNNLRNQMKEKRKSLTKEDKKTLDKKIFDNLINSEIYKNSKTVFTFVSYNHEVDTHNIIKKALQDNKIVCVPKVISKKGEMISIKINSFNDLIKGTYDILEPNNTLSEISPKEIDLVLVPGLAFDKKGGRMGYGGGFYDRFLKTVSMDCKKIGLAYDFQIIENVPMNKNDVPIDDVFSEKVI